MYTGVWPVFCNTYGLSGAFWYSTAAAINITLFPPLSVQFKTRAPGAKTYLQVIQARFGKVTHTLFCFFALLINLVILTAICVVGVALIQNLVTNASPEFCMLIIAVLCGSYSLIGGLGSTFYVSYFNAFMVFSLLAVIIVNVFYLEHDDYKLLGDVDAIYSKIACLKGPETNAEESYLTFWSASWQSRIAAKPVQGVWGFLLATFVWFAIPSTIGTTTGLTYLALEADNASLALSEGDINAGLVTAYVTQLVMGRVGAFLILTMFTMLVMSTGSGEIMAVSSIIVYDIYQTYINPFRRNLSSGLCVLCGGAKPQDTSAGADSGGSAKHFERRRPEDGRAKTVRVYKCQYHGEYRQYQDSLVKQKSWIILWITIGLVPFGLLVHSVGVDLNWVILTGSIVTIPCFPGSLGGLICGFSVNLIYASTFEGGLQKFLLNTAEPYAVLAGCCTSLFVALILSVVVSLCTHRISSKEDEEAVWLKLRQINNPLHPWVEKYREEFPDLQPEQEPTFQQLSRVFRKAKVTAIVGSAVSILVLVVLVPGVMAALHVLSANQFSAWFTALQVWCLVMGLVVVVVTPVEEVRSIWRQVSWNRQRRYSSSSRR
nr:hypothetical protein BaRGS_013326 [Batillaria attramentaria]